MERLLFEEIPHDKPVPLTHAHRVVGKARSTVYAWVARGLLEPVDGPEGMTVTPAQLREAETKVRHGGPRRAKGTRSDTPTTE